MRRILAVTVAALIVGVAVSVPSGSGEYVAFSIPTTDLEAVWQNTDQRNEVCRQWNSNPDYRSWLPGWLQWKLREDADVVVSERDITQFIEGKCDGNTGTEVGA